MRRYQVHKQSPGLLDGRDLSDTGRAIDLYGDTTVVVQDENVFPARPDDGALANIDAVGAGATVHPCVVTTLGDATLMVAVPKPLRFDSLEIHATGDSVVQWDVPALQIDSHLKLTATGDGDVVIRTTSLVVHGQVHTKLTGDANVRVAASTLQLDQTLLVDNTGDAKVYLGAKQRQSSCPTTQITAIGDSDIDLGALTCTDASIKTTGDANVTVKVIHALAV